MAKTYEQLNESYTKITASCFLGEIPQAKMQIDGMTIKGAVDKNRLLEPNFILNNTDMPLNVQQSTPVQPSKTQANNPLSSLPPKLK